MKGQGVAVSLRSDGPFSHLEDSTEIWAPRASEPVLSRLVEVFIFFCGS